MYRLNLIKELLTLHYVFPLPLNKFQKLANTVDSLRNLTSLNANTLAKILSVSTDFAQRILTNYERGLKIDLIDKYRTAKIIPITYEHASYPPSLLQLIDPPTVLYAKGDISLLSIQPKIAVIGSRHATSYSKIAMDFIIPTLVKENIVIVSGLAKGADAFAHDVTIMNGGKTIAVLGHGFSHQYPKENKKLFEKIEGNHLLLTEYPPYMGVQKWHFPMRNRIISGISNAVVVTEATLKSGTLITTEHALENGKDVFVVPGPIHSEQSLGTNRLLREGAIPIWNGEQIVEELKLFFR